MEYLLKPYSEKELVAVVEEVIRLNLNYNKEEAGTDEFPLMGKDVHSAEQGMDGEEVSPSRMNVLVSMVEEYIRGHYMDDVSMQDAARSGYPDSNYFARIYENTVRHIPG